MRPPRLSFLFAAAVIVVAPAFAGEDTPPTSPIAADEKALAKHGDRFARAMALIRSHGERPDWRWDDDETPPAANPEKPQTAATEKRP